MSKQEYAKKVEADLAAAVSSGAFPDNVAERAAQTLARLRQPVRITLLGLPGSGKSALLNLLVGADVMKDGVRLPTMQLRHGDAPRAVCTLPDGSTADMPHADVKKIAASTPVFVEMELPLPALGKISVLEVVAPNDLKSQHRALKWAIKRSDVTLWCTQTFNEMEQQLWSGVPDIIKDHAFLMLTKADEMLAAKVLQSNLSTIKSVALDDFNQILPIATIDAIAARQPDGSVNKDQMRASGGLALISAVLRQVDQGRQSTIDTADILLRTHLKAAAPAPKQAAKPAPPESVVVAKPKVAATHERTVADIKMRNADAAPTKKQPEKSNVVELRPATRDAYQHALKHIAKQGKELAGLASELGDAAPPRIIAKAAGSVQWLSEYLNEHGDDGDPALARARDSAMDAADLIQLMQMEKRDSAAVEALSLMIQLKHELQADVVV